jgi:esterase/lipase
LPTLLKWAERAKLPDFGIPKWDTDIADPEARRTHVSYRLQPTHFAISMQNAGTRLMDELFRMHCPTLIAHGAHDHACPVANAWEVAERLGTPDSRVVILPRSRHVICRDLDRTILKNELESFFRRLS